MSWSEQKLTFKKETTEFAWFQWSVFAQNCSNLGFRMLKINQFFQIKRCPHPCHCLKFRHSCLRVIPALFSWRCHGYEKNVYKNTLKNTKHCQDRMKNKWTRFYKWWDVVLAYSSPSLMQMDTALLTGLILNSWLQNLWWALSTSWEAHYISWVPSVFYSLRHLLQCILSLQTSNTSSSFSLLSNELASYFEKTKAMRRELSQTPTMRSSRLPYLFLLIAWLSACYYRWTFCAFL